MGVDMTQEEYNALLKLTRETRDLAIGNKSCIDQIAEKVDDLHEVLYKNGFMARIVRLEQVVASERERVDLKFDSQGQVSGLQIGHVKESSIDWRFVVNALLGSGILMGLIYSLLSRGGI